MQDGDIYVWENGKVRRLLELGNAAWPRWSPDGSRIAFVRLGDAYSDLYVARSDGQGIVQLTRNQPGFVPGSYQYVQNAVWALSPTWSPDGTALVYASDLNSLKNFLWRIPSAGGTPQRIEATTRLGDNVDQPSFSPDGTRIVFIHRVTREDGLQRRTDLWIVDLRTGNLAPLVQGGDGQYAPVWSPDGLWIAYVGRHGEANDLFVVPASGGQPVQLTDSGVVAAPTWSPDGRTLAFLQLDQGKFVVYTLEFSVSPEGQPRAGQPRKLFEAENIDTVSGLSWAR
ncbi:MAG: LpqB family beta-propeller domain-containing protein [Thermomicrobium sp.]|nr:LpqB family beta-propeller domain-containing protein [Thermomicrobium sp.]MDW8059962.1 LpqB family beta-propeller domain-containing protein [Thermomicrobium sp.]